MKHIKFINKNTKTITIERTEKAIFKGSKELKVYIEKNLGYDHCKASLEGFNIYTTEDIERIAFNLFNSKTKEQETLSKELTKLLEELENNGFEQLIMEY